jgi:GTP-binding protein
MSDQPDEAEIAAAEKLFAGPCDFYWGAAPASGLPPAGAPEIAFAGRSNVGKSSLINALTGRKALARVSQMPGRTREINFFALAGKLVLVDLPGYGYAKASKQLAAEWQESIYIYLRGRAALKRVVLLIDARRGLMDVDHAVLKLLDGAAVSYLPVLTKFDQLTPSARTEAVDRLSEEMRRHTAAYPAVLVTSALRKTGLESLKTHLAALTEAGV